MAKHPERPEPIHQPKSPQQEADALIDELTHPRDPNEESDEPETAQEKAVSAISTTAKVFFNWIITPFAIVLVLHFFVFQAYQVVGTSMDPTLHGSDYLIISKVGQSFAKAKSAVGSKSHYVPKRGDVVVFEFPLNHKQTFVKRVIGLPGDRVVVKDGEIKVFNKQKPEGFSPDTGFTPSEPITLGSDDRVVPAGHIYVVGDNRSPGGSYDSREWGPLPSEDIIGIAVLRLLPLSGLRFL